LVGEEEEPGSSQGRLDTLPDGSPHGLGSMKRGERGPVRPSVDFKSVAQGLPSFFALT